MPSGISEGAICDWLVIGSVHCCHNLAFVSLYYYVASKIYDQEVKYMFQPLANSLNITIRDPSNLCDPLGNFKNSPTPPRGNGRARDISLSIFYVMGELSLVPGARVNMRQATALLAWGSLTKTFAMQPAKLRVVQKGRSHKLRDRRGVHFFRYLITPQPSRQPELQRPSIHAS